MSKLAMIRQYRYSPAAGGLFGTIGKFLGGAVNAVTGLNIFKSKAPTPAAPIAAAAPSAPAVAALFKSGGGTRKKGRGITATELRGYRKIAGLLHKEGMVSKRLKGKGK